LVPEFSGDKIGASHGRLAKLIGKLSLLSETDRTMADEVRGELLSAVDELRRVGEEVGVEGANVLSKQLNVGKIHFDNMLETVDLMAIVLDCEGEILSCNDFFLNRTGWARDEVVGRNWFETFVPSDQVEERRGRYFGRVQGHLKCSCYPIDVLTREKQRRQFIWNESFLRDAEGNIIGMAGIGEDVTERRRLEEKLTRQCEDYRVIFDSVPALIWYLDREGKILRINESARRVMGVSEGAVCHRSFSEMFPEAGERIFAEIEDIVRTGKAIRNRVEKLVLPSGESRWLMADKIPYAVKSGLVAGVILFAKDITASREKDEVLRESQRKLATLMSNLPGMAYRCRNDRDYTLEFVSEGCKDLTGYDSEDLVGNHKMVWSEIIHPEDMDRVWSQIQTAMRERRAFQLEYRMISADGRKKWVWEQGSGVFSPGGEAQALEGFIADITQRKEAEKALRESESQLKSVLSSLVDIVFGFDREGRFIFCNCPPESKLLVPPEVFMGKKHSEILPPHIDDVFRKAFESVRQGKFRNTSIRWSWMESFDGFRSRCRRRF
jgi:PAS domain S-box-containing protein